MLRRIPPIIVALLLLAAYGFLWQVIQDPISTLIVIGLSVLLFVAVRNYLRSGSFFSSAYKHKQAKPKTAPRPSMKKTSPASRKNHPFRVIEGAKSKSKEKQEHDPQNHISQ
jgi:hypothetical protein